MGIFKDLVDNGVDKNNKKKTLVVLRNTFEELKKMQTRVDLGVYVDNIFKEINSIVMRDEDYQIGYECQEKNGMRYYRVLLSKDDHAIMKFNIEYNPNVFANKVVSFSALYLVDLGYALSGISNGECGSRLICFDYGDENELSDVICSKDWLNTPGDEQAFNASIESSYKCPLSGGLGKK